MCPFSHLIGCLTFVPTFLTIRLEHYMVGNLRYVVYWIVETSLNASIFLFVGVIVVS